MNQLCKVCSEPAAGYHFGAFTCEGCKSFFGRTYNNLGALGECKNNGQCVINKKNRTSCKSCRLKKCLVVGMSKSGSRYGRRSNWFKIHCLIQDQAEMKSRLKSERTDGMTEDTTEAGDEDEDAVENMTTEELMARDVRDSSRLFHSDLMASHAHLLQQQQQKLFSSSSRRPNHASGQQQQAQATSNNNNESKKHEQHNSSSHRSHQHTSHNQNNNNHHHQHKSQHRKSAGSPSSNSTISSNSPPGNNNNNVTSSKDLLQAAAAFSPFSHLMHFQSAGLASPSGAPSVHHPHMHHPGVPHADMGMHSAQYFMSMAAAAAVAASQQQQNKLSNGSSTRGSHRSRSLTPSSPTFSSSSSFSPSSLGPGIGNPVSSAHPASKDLMAAAAAAAALKPFSHLFLHPAAAAAMSPLHAAQHQADLMSMAAAMNAAAAVANAGKVTSMEKGLKSRQTSAPSGKLTPASGILSDLPEQETPIDLSIRSEDEEDEDAKSNRTRSCSPADSFESDIEVSAY